MTAAARIRSGLSLLAPLVRVALPVCADAFLVLALVQIPGCVTDTVVRQRVGGPMAFTIKIWVVAIALALAGRYLRASHGGEARPTRFPGLRLAGALAGAFVLAWVLSFYVVPRPSLERKVISDLDLVVESPSQETTDCSPTRGCHVYKVNEFGFRGPTVRRDHPDTLVIAVVGDSHVYGIGVDEEETMPAALQRRLRERGRDVRVGNAGIPGLSMVSYPSTIEYANRVYDPHLVIALIKEDDVDAVDHNTRMLSLERDLSTRLLYVLNLEIVVETARQGLRYVLSSPVPRDSFADWLDETRRRTADRKLLLVTDLNPPLGSIVGGWIEQHPDVGWYSSWESQAWQEAPRITGDGHWNGQGNDVIAGLIETAVVRMLDGEQVRPRTADGT